MNETFSRMMRIFYFFLELMKLLFSILCANPELRATVSNILADEWLNQPVDITKYKWEEVVRDTEFQANNAGDQFRGNEPSCRGTNLDDKENLQQEPSSARLERCDINEKNECTDKIKSNNFNSNLNQIVLMSKSF